MFIIVVGVYRIRSTHQRTVEVNIEEKQEMEWDNSALTITVNPMDSKVTTTAYSFVALSTILFIKLGFSVRQIFEFNRLFREQMCENLPPVTPDEVKKLLSGIPGKSCPLDFIPTSLIKSCSGVFSELISRLANLSFTEGCFPAMFKQAIVTPLLKNLVLINPIHRTTAQFQIWTIFQNYSNACFFFDFNRTSQIHQILTHCSQPTAASTPQKHRC